MIYPITNQCAQSVQLPSGHRKGGNKEEAKWDIKVEKGRDEMNRKAKKKEKRRGTM